MRIGVKDLDADMISASIVVVLDAARDLGDVTPGEQGIDETITAARGQVRFPRFPGGPEAWLNGAGRREQHHACTTPVPSGAAGPGGGAGLVERSADRPHRRR